MLRWAMTFLLLAVVAAFLGLGPVTSLALEIARILLVVFLIVAVISLITGRSVSA